MEGLVTRAVTGFFAVSDRERVRMCRARGVFRKKGVNVLVGDRVQFEPIGTQEGVITEVLPRRTVLVRPPIANVDQALLVASVVSPEFHPGLMDRMLVCVHAAGLDPVIVLTKCDLASDEQIHKVAEPYRKAKYVVVEAASPLGLGIDQVRRMLQGKVTVLAGASGVGKSTLANALAPGLGLKMGDISEKLGRGKHTTRHVELYPIGEGTYLADAPGFSQLDVPVESADLRRFFPEFQKPANDCAYRGCLHVDEVDCGVKRAVEQAEISPLRYQSYRSLLLELREREEHQY